MDYAQIGHEIKILRKTQGISQKDLSDGICTQAQISKIENGEVHPLSSTLYLIAKRLGVDVNYFYSIGYAPHHEYVQEVEYQIRRAVHYFKYEEVRELIKVEKRNPLLKKLVDFKQFIIWNEGICCFHLDNDSDKAIGLLNQALQLTTFNKNYLSEREIEIMNSLGIIYDGIKSFAKAIESFDVALKSYQKISYITNDKIFPKVCFNLARSLTRSKEFERSIAICQQGIDWCKQYQLLYLLGELYYQLGLNHRRLSNIAESVRYFRKSVTILELLDKKQLIEHITSRFSLEEETDKKTVIT